ncbi:porin [Paraburkholderia sp. 1N]|uniref:Porin n=1 Tax=Paraburkholderia solitsugae TaxID=2675748 RepID=A0ABX2C0H5_9BURK|nr:porin [Paraburkholderia solitsugae]NPT45793.1 porin [Paraburkholderia solitsugae]
MKKKPIALGICATLICGYAHAQSAVTLYGAVDSGIAYIHNSGGQSSQWKFQSSNLSISQWGLKGTEDLGGGTSTVFDLENGFDSGTGEADHDEKLFGRQAYVGLANDRLGTVTLGRQYDPITDLLQLLTADVYSGWFATPGDVDNYDSSARFNNSVKWASPTWNGVQGSIMYAFGGVAGATGSGQTYSAALAYTGAALSVAGGYLHIDNGNPTLSARGVSSSDSIFNSPVNSAYASARSIDIARVGGQYVLGSYTVGAAYSYSRYVPDAASTYQDAEKYHNGSVFAIWQATPAFQVIGAYNYTRAVGDSSAKYHQFNVGADYNLSKRTDVYAFGGYQHALGENGFGAAEASMGSLGIAAGKSTQEVVVVGLRHRF